MCLIYPSHYRTGMSNLGFQTVYRLLNAHPDILCERAFVPDPGDEKFFAPGSLPLFSLESQKPLADFDILAFSLSFENDYPQILKILEMARLPLPASQRDDRHPLVLAGGIAVTLNPEPIADFIDAFVLGEAEEVIPELLPRLVERRKAPPDRDALLRAWQKEVPGVYAPRFYSATYKEDGTIRAFGPVAPEYPARIPRRWVRDLDAHPVERVIATPETELAGMVLVEVGRGCGRGCRFCAAGFVYRPPRVRAKETLVAAFDRGLEAEGRIGLVGTAVSDHPAFLDLCQAILDRGGRVAVGSLRVDRMAPQLLETLRRGGIETLSLAPEAGSQRLRDLIRKGLAEDDILRMADLLLAAEILNLRLYFMVGLPTETDEDIDETILLIRKLADRRLGEDEARFRRITVSINAFIPKPATPLQWCPLAESGLVRKRLRRIADAFRGNRQVQVQAETSRATYLQALLSLGDRRVGALLLAVHEAGGRWATALKGAVPPPDFYVHRPKGRDEILPWDFIDTDTPKAFLRREYDQALA